MVIRINRNILGISSVMSKSNFGRMNFGLLDLILPILMKTMPMNRPITKPVRIDDGYMDSINEFRLDSARSVVIPSVPFQQISTYSGLAKVPISTSQACPTLYLALIQPQKPPTPVKETIFQVSSSMAIPPNYMP